MRSELVRALAVLCESPGHHAIATALDLEAPTAAEHTELFIHQLPPYASIYLGEEGKIGGEAQDRIAGFWRAVGIVPPVEPDHLAALLGLWANLLDAAADDEDPPSQLLADHAHHALVWEHLGSWLTPYLARVAAIAAKPYVEWSRLLGEALAEAIRPGPRALPAHLSAETKPPDDDLLAFLLSPIRSGMILTRADLHRVAGELGLGIRVGERAFALKSLLAQDRRAVLRWIGGEARRQANEHESAALDPSIGRVWISRAVETASLLEDLATSSVLGGQ